MRKKNPLHYDLSLLPESSFKTRRFSRYRKKFPRKRTIKKYLPTLDLYVWTEEVFLEALGYPPMDWKNDGGNVPPEFHHDLSVQSAAFRRYFRNLRGEVGSDWNQRQEQLIEALGGDSCCLYIIPRRAEEEQLTPFMIIHDVMEEVQFLGAEGEFPLDVEDEMQMMSYGIISIPKPTTMLRLTPFVPKLKHTHPDYEARYKKRSQSEIDRQATQKGYYFEQYSRFIDEFRMDTDLTSDLWALWCVKEKLTPQNFYPPQMVVDEMTRRYDLDKSRMSWNSVTLQDYCDALNSLFSQVLQALRGRIIGM